MDSRDRANFYRATAFKNFLVGGTADPLVPRTAELVDDLVQNVLNPAANMLVAAHVSRPVSTHAHG